MQAVIEGCRFCQFPSSARQKTAAAEARRDPCPHAGRHRHRLGSAGNGVGRAPGPSHAEARPHVRAPSSWRFQPPNNGQPITPCKNKEVFHATSRTGRTGTPPRAAPAGGRGARVPLATDAWRTRPLRSCYSSFSSPSVGAWSSGMRSSSTPRTPQRRTRATPSSPARAGWRSPPRCWR